MLKTLVHCPHCRNEIALEEARTEIPDLAQSTWNKKVQWVYTVCPRCQRDFRVTGEKRVAVVVLCFFFGIIAIGFFVDSWLPLAAAIALLLIQKKVMQLFIRTTHA